MKRVTFSVMLLLILQSSASLAQAKGEPKIGSREKLRVEIAEAEAKVLDFASRLRAQADGAATALRNPRLTKAILLNETRGLFDLQSKLQVMELDAASAKIEVSRLLLEKRRQNVNAIVSERVDRLLEIPPRHASPEAAVAALERFAIEKDWEGYLGMLTDDELRRIAGLTLRMVDATRGLLESDNDPAQADSLAVLTKLRDDSMRRNPPADAVAAKVRLDKYPPMFSFYMGSTREPESSSDLNFDFALDPDLSAARLSELLRQSSGLLSDPSDFTVEALKLIDGAGPSERPTPLESNWSFRVAGNSSRALQKAKPRDRTILHIPEVLLVEQGGWWKIASMLPEADLLKAIQGSSEGRPRRRDANAKSPQPLLATDLSENSRASQIPTLGEGRWKVERYFTEGKEHPELSETLELLIDRESVRIMAIDREADQWQMSAQFFISWPKSQTRRNESNIVDCDFVLDPNGEGIAVQAICDQHGDTLRICMGDIGATPPFRPQWFVSGSRVTLIECSRVESDSRPKLIE